MKKQNNKGFSLVELIVVIAIMAVLVGVLAPQYLKYVNNAKVSTDITNVDNAVQAINASIADGKIDSASLDWSTACTTAGLTAAPALKANEGATTTLYYTLDKGVQYVTVTVDSKLYEIYPNPENESAATVATGVATEKGYNEQFKK